MFIPELPQNWAGLVRICMNVFLDKVQIYKWQSQQGVLNMQQ